MANAEDRIRALREEFQRKEKALVVNEGDWGSDRWARIEDERARKKEAIKERIARIEDLKRGKMGPTREDKEEQKLRRDMALRRKFRQSGHRENEVSPLQKEEGNVQGFLNEYGPASLRSQPETIRRILKSQGIKDDRVRVTKENAEAMKRGVDPALASSAKTAAYENLTGTENDLENYREEAGKKAYEKDRYARKFEEYKREDEPKEEEGFLSRLARKGGETVDDVKDYFSGATAEKEGAEAAYAPRNEVDPGLKKAAGKNIAEWVAHTKNNPEDVTTSRRKKQMEDMSKRLNLSGISDRIKAEEEGRGLEKSFNSEGGSPDYDPSYAASLDQGNVEQQVVQGMAKDEVERAVNEDFQGLPPIAQLDKGEQKEVLEEVAKAKGKQSEEYLAAKEDTGDYIRYQDGKFVINKRAISQDFQRKERMDMLKDIPVANRAAMLASWGYIDSDDLTVAQKQSAKQIKEMSLLDLKIAKATSDAESAKGKLSAQDKTSYDAAHKGLLDALKSGDYSLADTYRKEINKIAPSSDTSSYSNIIEKRVKANKVMTPPKLFKKYGLKDGTAYYKSRESIVKAISLFDNGKGTSNDFAALMGQTVQAGDQKGKPISELMKNHGIYSWKEIQSGEGGSIPKKYTKDEQSYMAWALPTIKKSLLTEIWGGLHRDIEKLALSNDSRGVRAEAAKFNGDDVAGGTSSPREEDKIAKEKANKPALEKAKKEANAKKVKVNAQKAFSKEIEKNKRFKQIGKKTVYKTETEKKKEYMVEGKEYLDRLVKGQLHPKSGKKYGLAGQPKFGSAKEAIKYYKNNPTSLKSMSLQFRHFISQQ